jgi:hypothetical protein
MHTSGEKLRTIERIQSTVYEDWSIIKKKELPVGSSFIKIGIVYGAVCELYVCFGKLYAVIIN